MPKMVVAIDGVVIKEVPLTQERTTVGRRPYNDVVIDNLAVSGEHAVFVLSGDDVLLHDLGSTNGTYVNAKAVTRQELRNGDIIEVGKYKIRFLQEAEGENFEKTISIPAEFVSNHIPHFALRVNGDSMIGAGILSGDIAIIEQSETAKNGDIVVALLDENVTLKRFYIESNRYKLQAENLSYAPIYTQDLRILGRLRGIYRSY